MKKTLELFPGSGSQVISASRRSDIPAWYADWFIRRIQEGYCVVPNPLFPRQQKTVSLRPEDVAAIVFWTRHTEPLRKHLDVLDRLGYRYLFLYTLTGYPSSIESGLGDARHAVEDVLALAERVGPDRVIWRYDPVLFAPGIDAAWHRDNFRCLASSLAGGTNRVVITFLQLYRHLHSRLCNAGIYHVPEDEEMMLASSLCTIAREYGIQVRSCGDRRGARFFEQGACIDHRHLRDLFGLEMPARKDPGQPAVCRCIQSVDIGVYNTCLHGCVYCYATRDFAVARRCYAEHDPCSSALCTTDAVSVS
ncbi:DUF1848 domain-containing protein [Prosthecochloris sp. N3]|uniref:DUF1848 domain-containing protein n=1 Tax=Prosthecochloris ethylica TaxID=2743976 RepID=A0ABR9XNR3_9CHLB|nr:MULTISPECIES: DUF1848 domain-containing protein [Prosthecochloris]MBF0585698.1 DUF1848 domain-containing protein [Prosthecochloris ethylica]MBF0635608.1 DUF1848 domain-containing protein [Prosthecochloris ethylica]NUK46907.1 DUF1848 domain-containing protein [Prosthecochloris ethylica]RNA65405.1 DUF1848 domain-containing protein [Prosthecochloris sp. ZM_2]